MKVNRQRRSQVWMLWLALLAVVALSVGMLLYRGQSAADLIPLGSGEPARGQGVRPVEPNNTTTAVAQTTGSETGTPDSEPAVAEVVEAFDCARSKHKLPAYVRDAGLDAEANKILKQLRDDPTIAAESEGKYLLFAHLTVDPTAPKSGCAVGEFDVARVGKADLEKAQHIGVAVASTTLYDQSLQTVIVIGQ